MGYCRFQNTLKDLKDCLDNITDNLSYDEHKARERMIKVCQDIIDSKDNGDIPENPENY